MPTQERYFGHPVNPTGAVRRQKIVVIPGRLRLHRRRTRLRRQDAGANIGAADGPTGEPQDAASLSILIFVERQHGFRVPPANNAGGPGMTK
jgi:hypothetical protein